VSVAPRHGIVASGAGGVWRVIADDGCEYDAVLRGRLKKADTGRRADGSIRRNTVASASETVKLAVGDRVSLESDEPERAWAITEILPRKSRLARRAPGGGKGERVLAANVDQVLVMFAAAKPEPHPRMLDRFLVIAEANDLAARIVINKVELVGEVAARGMFADYERAGYPMHFTSVKQRIGIDAVGEILRGRITVVSGPSGVGKSSLLNALFPGLGLRVAEVSESVNKGRHTTVGAFLHPLPAAETHSGGGGAVVDTPGLREIGMWELPIGELGQCFPELRVLSDQCRFADCAHIAEPRCAVRAGVEAGEISRARYESYVKLRAEIAEEKSY
jgi:ribosome biogenesis GTPase